MLVHRCIDRCIAIEMCQSMVQRVDDASMREWSNDAIDCQIIDLKIIDASASLAA
jgi:hypothetical protein